MRLNRFISKSGICSRRNADLLIISGQITVNYDIVFNLGANIDPEKDIIYYNNTRLTILDKIYLVWKKPKEILCNVTPCEAKKLFNIDIRVFPVNRVNKKDTGCILFTNDGDLHQQLIGLERNSKLNKHFNRLKDNETRCVDKDTIVHIMEV